MLFLNHFINSLYMQSLMLHNLYLKTNIFQLILFMKSIIILILLHDHNIINHNTLNLKFIYIFTFLIQ